MCNKFSILTILLLCISNALASTPKKVKLSGTSNSSAPESPRKSQKKPVAETTTTSRASNLPQPNGSGTTTTSSSTRALTTSQREEHELNTSSAEKLSDYKDIKLKKPKKKANSGSPQILEPEEKFKKLFKTSELEPKAKNTKQHVKSMTPRIEIPRKYEEFRDYAPTSYRTNTSRMSRFEQRLKDEFSISSFTVDPINKSCKDKSPWLDTEGFPLGFETEINTGQLECILEKHIAKKQKQISIASTNQSAFSMLRRDINGAKEMLQGLKHWVDEAKSVKRDCIVPYVIFMIKNIPNERQSLDDAIHLEKYNHHIRSLNKRQNSGETNDSS